MSFTLYSAADKQLGVSAAVTHLGAGAGLVSFSGFTGMLSTSLPKPVRNASNALGGEGAAADAVLTVLPGFGATVATGASNVRPSLLVRYICVLA